MAARISRSRSPSQHKQPSKRRNTMNSRLDDTLKEIMEATAAEAAGKDPNATVGEEPAAGNDAEDDGESQANNKKKRKRTEDEVYVSILPYSRSLLIPFAAPQRNGRAQRRPRPTGRDQPIQEMRHPEVYQRSQHLKRPLLRKVVAINVEDGRPL